MANNLNAYHRTLDKQCPECGTERYVSKVYRYPLGVWVILGWFTLALLPMVFVSPIFFYVNFWSSDYVDYMYWALGIAVLGIALNLSPAILARKIDDDRTCRQCGYQFSENILNSTGRLMRCHGDQVWPR